MDRIQEQIETIQRVAESALRSKEAAIKFLVDSGIKQLIDVSYSENMDIDVG